jgi:hypothetical protein
MLMLTLPSGEMSGECRINGNECEIDGNRLSFRLKGGDEYDTRTILQAKEGPKLTMYVCTSKEGGGGTVITPTLLISGA